MPDCSIIGRKPALLPYHGWLVVAAAFFVALYGFGLGFYGPGIYLVALKALHGWPTRELSSAVTAYYVLGAPYCSSGSAPFLIVTGHKKLSRWGPSRWRAEWRCSRLLPGPGMYMRRLP
jgi:hypothetical protein